MAHMVESAFYAKEPAWHGLGVVVDSTLTSEEALKVAGLDWMVKPEQIFLKDGATIEGKVANVRQSDRNVLGIVSDRYRIVQNRDAFAFIDGLLENDVTPVRFESAGSLAEGRRVWMLAHLPAQMILGDEIIPYLVFANSHDGSMAITAAMTPTRVVCQNTLTLAVKNAPRSWSIRHVGDIKGKQQDAAETLRLSTKYMENMNATAEKYQQAKLTPASMEDIMAIIFPDDPEASNQVRGNTLNQKQQFLNIYAKALATDLHQFKGDAWGLYNGFADYATHSVPVRETKNFRENRFASFIDGNQILGKAQKAIEEVLAV